MQADREESRSYEEVDRGGMRSYGEAQERSKAISEELGNSSAVASSIAKIRNEEITG